MSCFTSCRISSKISAILFKWSLFIIFSFLNSSYTIPDQLSSLKLEACGSRYKLRPRDLSLSRRKPDQWAEVIPLRVLPLHWSLIPGPSHHRGLFLTSNGPGISTSSLPGFPSSVHWSQVISCGTLDCLHMHLMTRDQARGWQSPAQDLQKFPFKV